MHKTAALSFDSYSLARLKTDAHALQAFTVGESEALVKMGWEFFDGIVLVMPAASVKNRTAGHRA